MQTVTDSYDESRDEIVPGERTGRHVVFSHGKDGDPWSFKMLALGDTARAEGYEVTSVDYRGLDSVRERIELLKETCRGLQGELILIGSSLGGYVSLAAAGAMHARGIFLMAPAIYMDGLAPLAPRSWDCAATIVHAWEDEVVPVEHSIRFARENRIPLHLVNSDHRLHVQMPAIRYLFEQFLLELPVRPQLF